MKLSMVSMAIALAVGSISTAHAIDGTISFEGVITDTTCLVEGVTPGEGNANKTINLREAPRSALAAAGDTSNDRGFTITVGGPGDTACTNGKTAYVRFDPSSPAIDVASGRLNNDIGAGLAQNVQVEVLNVNGSPINLFTEDSQGVVIADNTAVIPMISRFYATGAATAGNVRTRVGFTVVYD